MMNLAGYGEKSEAVSRNLPRTGEYHERLSQDSRCPGRDLNPPPPVYKSEASWPDSICSMCTL
jgi:hypothetical protein